MSLKQLGAHAENVKIAAFLLGFGLALGLGIIATSMFYEAHFKAALAWQRTWDRPLLENTGLESSWRGRIKGWSDRINKWAINQRWEWRK